MGVDEKLAQLLENYPIIWNRARKDFRDTKKKELAFRALAKDIGTTVEVVIGRYKALREKYRKEKSRVTPSGSAATPTDDTWDLYDHLRFFDGVMISRKRTSNMEAPEPKQLEQLEPAEEVLQIVVDSQDDEYDAEGESDISLLSPTPTISSECEVPRKKRVKNNQEGAALADMLQTVKQTAAILSAPVLTPAASVSKFAPLGQYIASVLEALDTESANQKVAQIMRILAD